MPALNPYKKIQELDQAASHSASRRKVEGITYTPPAIARSMVSLLDPQPDETLIEPSCGRGVFLFALVEHWQTQGRSWAWIDQWAQQYLFACDLDIQAVEDLRGLWQEFFASRGHVAAPLNVQVQDGLFGAWSTKRFSAVLGNPPYVRIQHLAEDTREQIRGKYASCAKGNVDLYYAFLEDALTRADRLCLITPNSWMSNDSAKTLRQMMLPRLAAVIDFGARLVFAPVRAYTAITLCQAQPGSTIRVRDNLPEEGGDWQTLERNDPRWAPNRFTPLAPAQMNGGAVLGDQFEVLSGIATLADHAFTLAQPRLGKRRMVLQADPLNGGQDIEVPEQYAPRLVKITKPGVLDRTGPRILYPYTDGAIEQEATLRTTAPGLLDWLARRRTVLDGRDKGKTQDYDAWYAYGRRQGLWQAQPDEQLLLLPQMGNGALRPLLINSADIGPFLFTSGFVIRAKPGVPAGALKALEKHLKSAQAWEFVQQEGKAWAGKGDYRTLGARALRRMPIPAHLV